MFSWNSIIRFPLKQKYRLMFEAGIFDPALKSCHYGTLCTEGTDSKKTRIDDCVAIPRLETLPVPRLREYFRATALLLKDEALESFTLWRPW